MFTGLVETTGTVERLERRGPGYRLRLAASLGPLVEGESVAVSGACLTVTEPDSRGFAADVSLETATRTIIGGLATGAAVNLERALRLGDRLGGHLVSGHVDAVVALERLATAGEARRAVFALPASLLGFVAPQGSVALDGVSLTVTDVRPGEFEVMLIPHTLGRTTLAALRPGRSVNLEVDLLARYVVACLRAPGASAMSPDGAVAEAPDAGDRGLIDALRRAGLM